MSIVEAVRNNLLDLRLGTGPSYELISPALRKSEFSALSVVETIENLGLDKDWFHPTAENGEPAETNTSDRENLASLVRVIDIATTAFEKIKTHYPNILPQDPSHIYLLEYMTDLFSTVDRDLVFDEATVMARNALLVHLSDEEIEQLGHQRPKESDSLSPVHAVSLAKSLLDRAVASFRLGTL